MRNITRITSVVLAAFTLLFLFAVLGSAGAVFTDYTNPDTGFRAVLRDSANLLTSEEEAEVMESIKPLTKYADMAVYTINTPTNQDEFQRAKELRKQLFGNEANSAIFVIDMYLRRITIERQGVMKNYFTNAKANNITNNVAKFATSKEYAICCENALSQMLDVIERKNIPSPMKHFSNALIAVALGLITAYVVASKTSVAPKEKGEKKASYDALNNLFLTVMSVTKIKYTNRVYKHVGSRTEHPYNPSSSSGSSCGSSCSSSCGSSCSSSSCGSSCGSSAF